MIDMSLQNIPSAQPANAALGLQSKATPIVIPQVSPKLTCGLCVVKCYPSSPCFNRRDTDSPIPGCSFTLRTDAPRNVIFGYFEKNYKFYADRDDPNHTIYVWRGNRWVANAESLVLEELASVFGNSPKQPVSNEKILNHLAGVGMKNPIAKKPAHIIAFNNGMLDLETMQLQQHASTFFYQNMIPWDFVPSQDCPHWKEFMQKVHHAEDIDFIQEWWGFNFYSTMPRSDVVFYYGQGNNGKTVELEVMQKVLGSENVTNVSLQDLNTNAFCSAELDHKLANISDDLPSTALKHASILKQATSGTPMMVQRKFGHPYRMEPYAKITYSCNVLPRLREDTDAIWDRMHIVEFPYHFVSNPDPAKGECYSKERHILTAELMAEVPGIINWALEGLQRLMKNHFRFSASKITDVRNFYRSNSNSVFAYFDDRIDITGFGGAADTILKIELYADYTEWCKKNNVRQVATQQRFFKDVGEQGIEDMRQGTRGAYCGIRFKP